MKTHQIHQFHITLSMLIILIAFIQTQDTQNSHSEYRKAKRRQPFILIQQISSLENFESHRTAREVTSKIVFQQNSSPIHIWKKTFCHYIQFGKLFFPIVSVNWILPKFSTLFALQFLCVRYRVQGKVLTLICLLDNLKWNWGRSTINWRKILIFFYSPAGFFMVFRTPNCQSQRTSRPEAS